ncbi:hypothetical protein BDK51DRAFT_42095 [Blyttiomyces helicus]|uniref:Uncharacterized protein n=1 Tax=Blyttiomyces helicus TaxID=388810 RepID=A0A4P9W9Y5_9FUNG|nr:hypothetical protein BDK51DRAFT_42095 [Blyttiomyces helicus]|eukprot:RKO88303.1 hypothetical protein BDK51DRAFT_42095 [Blyttiomyces helicus]
MQRARQRLSLSMRRDLLPMLVLLFLLPSLGAASPCGFSYHSQQYPDASTYGTNPQKYNKGDYIPQLLSRAHPPQAAARLPPIDSPARLLRRNLPTIETYNATLPFSALRIAADHRYALQSAKSVGTTAAQAAVDHLITNVWPLAAAWFAALLAVHPVVGPLKIQRTCGEVWTQYAECATFFEKETCGTVVIPADLLAATKICPSDPEQCLLSNDTGGIADADLEPIKRRAIEELASFLQGRGGDDLEYGAAALVEGLDDVRVAADGAIFWVDELRKARVRPAKAMGAFVDRHLELGGRGGVV